MKPGMMIYACNSNTQGFEAGVSDFQAGLGIIAVTPLPHPPNTHTTNTLKVREKRKPILMPNHRAYNTCTKDPNGVLNIAQIHFLQSHIQQCYEVFPGNQCFKFSQQFSNILWLPRRFILRSQCPVTQIIVHKDTVLLRGTILVILVKPLKQCIFPNLLTCQISEQSCSTCQILCISLQESNSLYFYSKIQEH